MGEFFPAVLGFGKLCADGTFPAFLLFADHGRGYPGRGDVMRPARGKKLRGRRKARGYVAGLSGEFREPGSWAGFGFSPPAVILRHGPAGLDRLIARPI